MFPLVIGLAGKAGTGKDYLIRRYVAPFFRRTNLCQVMAFADHFKLEAIVKDGLDRNKVFGKKDHQTRVALQKRGTEDGRDRHGVNIWVNIMREKILYEHSSRGIDVFIISDLRFPNEAGFIVSEMQGYIIRVDAPDRNADRAAEERGRDGDVSAHSSETALDDYPFRWIINNQKNQSENVVAHEMERILTEIIHSHSFSDEIEQETDDIFRSSSSCPAEDDMDVNKKK